MKFVQIDKAIFLMVLVALVVPSISLADEALAGMQFIISQKGQPFCATPENLLQYMLAGIKGEKTSKIQGCRILSSGTPILVLEDEPSGSDVSHVVRFLILNEKKFETGFTLAVGLQ